MNEPEAPAMTLDHAGIAALIPHSGSMCLLHSMQQHSAERIHCSATSHLDPLNPLRYAGALWAAAAIEYAAQAMALHGALNSARDGAGAAQLQSSATEPKAGYLASVRSVRLRVPRLDSVAGALQVQAWLLAGDSQQALYGFSLYSQAGELLADGRATVIMNAALMNPP